MGDKHCEICGVSIKPKFSLCFNCHESRCLPETLQFKDSFYKEGILKKEVYRDLPERLAILFQQGKKKMSMNKLRAFAVMVRDAYDTYQFSEEKKFDYIKPKLWKIITACEERTRREIIPPSFLDFIKSGIEIAVKDSTGRELYGFVELCRSVIAYTK